MPSSVKSGYMSEEFMRPSAPVFFAAFAFEPSVFNLELLARNIFGNDLVRQITIVPLPLSDTLAVNTLNMTSTEWGGALSSFGQS